MSDVAGGLRARFVIDSFITVVIDTLTELGWLTPGRSHKPIRVVTGPVPWDDMVTINTLAIIVRDNNFTFLELGSSLGADTMMAAVDFYAENDALGLHVTNDLRDALRGRLPVGAIRGGFPIYDYRMATPAQVGFAQVSDVTVERPMILAQEAWASHVHSLTCFVEDAYYGGGG